MPIQAWVMLILVAFVYLCVGARYFMGLKDEGLAYNETNLEAALRSLLWVIDAGCGEYNE